VYHFLFPSGFDEDAGQPTIKQGAASAYAKEVCFMEVLYKRCCGIDIHKNMMVACIFTSVRKKEIRQFSTMTEDILQLVSWLKETDCEMAAMESTGSYWKPVYNIFEEEQIPIMVVNAQHIKGVPGRKTDVKDAEWIADLVRHGLVKASYIPNRDIIWFHITPMVSDLLIGLCAIMMVISVALYIIQNTRTLKGETV
jgi:hypothetical protein